MTDFVKKAKLTELENTIPDVSNLATKSALATVENNHNHDKYIDASEFIKLAADIFNARIAPANLITKTDFDV